jgi:carbamoyl-phosphate synthase large subunit
VPAGKKSQLDSKPIRSAAVTQGIPYITTLEGAQAAISGMDSLERTGFSVKTIQEYCNTGQLAKKDVRKEFETKHRMWAVK